MHELCTNLWSNFLKEIALSCEYTSLGQEDYFRILKYVALFKRSTIPDSSYRSSFNTDVIQVGFLLNESKDQVLVGQKNQLRVIISLSFSSFGYSARNIDQAYEYFAYIIYWFYDRSSGPFESKYVPWLPCAYCWSRR